MRSDEEPPSVAGISIEPFDPGRHDLPDFSCWTDRLDNFLRFTASK